MPRIVFFMTGAVALVGVVCLRAQEEPASKRRFATTAEIAHGVCVASADGRTDFPIVAEPIYRFEDPARTFSGGGVWAFQNNGRPVALVTVALEKGTNGALQWVEELTLLSSEPIRADVSTPQRLWRWQPPPVGFRIAPMAPAPPVADDERTRLRQMRELARRFKAFEFWTPTRAKVTERYALRLLSQPVYRYRDPSAGIIDGAIFLFAYGQNPEVALVIEAGRDKAAAPSWSYGVGRLAAARLLIWLDDREVADSERPTGPFLETSYEALVFPADRPAE